MEESFNVTNFFLVSFLASVVGSICGIGGGVIIKPALDAARIMSVSSISYLSGATVLSVAIINVSQSACERKSEIDWKVGTPLAIGAVIGGVLGKYIFHYAYVILSGEDAVGALQSLTLALITAGALLYTAKADVIKTHQITNNIYISLIGLFLGLLSSFLGIGGGPINIVVLSYFFSMRVKKATINSLYIILFSQLASLIKTHATRSVPQFKIEYLVVMVISGVLGGLVGSRIRNNISDAYVRHTIIFAMVFIVLLNVYNAAIFLLKI